MKHVSIITVLVICGSILCMSLINPGASKEASKKVEPKLPPGELAKYPPPEPNDTCATAEKLTRERFGLDQYGIRQHGGETYDRVFVNSNNLDDWYKYTAGSHPSRTMLFELKVTVLSDEPQIEFEVYDSCYSLPLAHSMGVYDDRTGLWTYSLSEAIKMERTEWVEGETYYIHVNWIHPPYDVRRGITYDLIVAEFCTPIVQ